jgi:hypothetical protein
MNTSPRRGVEARNNGEPLKGGHSAAGHDTALYDLNRVPTLKRGNAMDLP